MREFKIGDLVIYTNEYHSNEWEKFSGISIYKEKGKIVEKDNDTFYMEFNKVVDPIQYRISLKEKKESYRLWVECDEIELDINHLKFKKWIKG